LQLNDAERALLVESAEAVKSVMEVLDLCVSNHVVQHFHHTFHCFR